MQQRVSGWLFVILLVASAALSWFAYYGIARLFDSEMPVQMAGLLLVSLFLHECGHWVVLRAYGVRAGMIFLVIGAGVFPLPGETDKFKALSWHRLAFMSLAGVMANTAIIVGALLLNGFGLMGDLMMLQLVNLNAVLVVFNLLPWWKLDGARFAEALFDSVPERLDRRYSTAMNLFAAVGILLLLLSVEGQVPTFAAAMFVYGVSKRAEDDDPGGSTSASAMTPRQSRWWAFGYCLLFLVGALFAAITPHWTM